MLSTMSAVGLLVMIAAIAALYATGSLLSPSPVVIGVQVAAVALMIWARITFGARSFHATAGPTEGGLVITGPYAYIRHPIYTAACLFAFAGALAHPSIVSCALALVLLAGGFVRMLAEERLVAQRYPDYANYAARTKRMVPFVF